MKGPGEHALTFRCEGDDLLAIVHEPAAPSAGRVGVLVIVGGPQYRVGSHRQFVLMARSFAASGAPVMRFDYRGMGDSDGAPRTFESIDADIAAAIDVFLRTRPELEGVVLWGLCDAASAVLMYCTRRDPRVLGLALANPWVHTPAAEATSYLRHYYLQRLLQLSFWRKLLSLQVGVGASIRDFFHKLGAAGGREQGATRRNFISRMLDGLRAFRGPVLVLLSERDLTARQFERLISTSGEWRTAMGRANVTVDHLAGTDHTFSDRAGLQRAATQSLAWLSRTVHRTERERARA